MRLAEIYSHKKYPTEKISESNKFIFLLTSKRWFLIVNMHEGHIPWNKLVHCQIWCFVVNSCKWKCLQKRECRKKQKCHLQKNANKNCLPNTMTHWIVVHGWTWFITLFTCEAIVALQLKFSFNLPYTYSICIATNRYIWIKTRHIIHDAMTVF